MSRVRIEIILNLWENVAGFHTLYGTLYNGFNFLEGGLTPLIHTYDISVVSHLEMYPKKMFVYVKERHMYMTVQSYIWRKIGNNMNEHTPARDWLKLIVQP